jgi:hypothetical protein
MRTLPVGSRPTDPGGLHVARPQRCPVCRGEQRRRWAVGDVADVGEAGEVGAPSRETDRHCRTTKARLCGRRLRSTTNNRAPNLASSRSTRWAFAWTVQRRLGSMPARTKMGTRGMQRRESSRCARGYTSPLYAHNRLPSRSLSTRLDPIDTRRDRAGRYAPQETATCSPGQLTSLARCSSVDGASPCSQRPASR